MIDDYIVETTLEEIEYKDWDFIWTKNESGYNFRVQFWRQDTVTGEWGWSNNMRPWPVEEWRNQSYLINTLYKAVATAEEHEMRENFKYKGKPRFSPHEG